MLMLKELLASVEVLESKNAANLPVYRPGLSFG
jgi:hypothetical protein